MTFRDLQFPLSLAPDRRLAETTDPHERVREKLHQVLFTDPGERVRRPSFGSGLRRLVFAPASVLTAASAQAMIRQAIDRFLADEIELLDVAVDPRPASDGAVWLVATIKYRRRIERDVAETSFEIPLGTGLGV